MAQRISIPISFRFMKTPVTWEIRTVKERHRNRQEELAFPRFLTDTAKPSELDGWACRDEFFNIPEGDSVALREFLEKVGLFLPTRGELVGHWSKEVMKHYHEEETRPVSVHGLWKLRDRLKRALVNREAFKEDYAAPQSDIEFPLSFELTRIASGVVTVTDAYHMLLATIFADVARGIRFKTCKREDCQKPFPIESEHVRKFCSQYCGHLVSQRKKREVEKKKRSRGKAKK